MKAKTFRTPRPAICDAVVELHLLMLRLLAQTRDPRATRIRKASMRATICIEHVALGIRPTSNLQRVFEDMVTIHLFARTLQLDGKLDERVFKNIRRRVDQIVAGIDQLEAVATTEWPALELAPLAPEEVDPTSPLEQARSQRMLARIADTERSLGPCEPPPLMTELEIDRAA